MPLTSPRSGGRAFPSAPIEWPTADIYEWVRRVAEAANRSLDGKTNAKGTFTLTASQATTLVDEPRCGPDSVILWMPTTANAAGEMGMYVTARGVETGSVRGFTVNHGTDSRTDRTFSYVVLG